MTVYYKATRPDGTSFQNAIDGTRVDYAAALASGEVIRHPVKRKVPNDAATYLSVSVEPADCTGFSWPCRLFRVEPVGPVRSKLDYPHKRAVSALRVVEELPAHMALGPNGEQVARFIETCRTITLDQARQLAATRAATWAATRAATRDAAWAAAWAATWDAAWAATWAAAWDATWAATRDATWAATRALLLRDRLTPEQFAILTGPWVSVMGEIA